MSQPEPAGNKVTSSDVVSPAEPLVTVFVTNAVRTSAGAGIGVRHLPASEAGRLCAMKYAVYGDRDPGEPAGPEPLVRSFGGPIPPPARKQHSN